MEKGGFVALKDGDIASLQRTLPRRFREDGLPHLETVVGSLINPFLSETVEKGVLTEEEAASLGFNLALDGLHCLRQLTLNLASRFLQPPKGWERFSLPAEQALTIFRSWTEVVNQLDQETKEEILGEDYSTHFLTGSDGSLVIADRESLYYIGAGGDMIKSFGAKEFEDLFGKGSMPIAEVLERELKQLHVSPREITDICQQIKPGEQQVVVIAEPQSNPFVPFYHWVGDLNEVSLVHFGFRGWRDHVFERVLIDPTRLEISSGEAQHFRNEPWQSMDKKWLNSFELKSHGRFFYLHEKGWPFSLARSLHIPDSSQPTLNSFLLPPR